jgi:uncharacterized PurR-regulated membrane protein YhhQ (DUF165 family)
MKYFSSAIYIVGIFLVNYLFPYLPMYSISGSVFSSGDVLIGVIYILRDFSQREVGGKVIYLMIVGCILSYLFASKPVAIASISAFAVGETIDWAIYSYTRRPFSERLLLSTLFSVPVDSIIFLYLLNQLNAAGFVVLTGGKVVGILFAWGYWRTRRDRVLAS